MGTLSTLAVSPNEASVQISASVAVIGIINATERDSEGQRNGFHSYQTFVFCQKNCNPRIHLAHSQLNEHCAACSAVNLDDELLGSVGGA